MIQDSKRTADYGLCLTSAPLINPSDFIGRTAEIDSMRQVLQPGSPSTEQRQLVLGGMGGIGKTQLAIAYARRYKASYTSVFWLNATSELTLKASFRLLAGRIVRPQELETLDDEQALARALAWLSYARNTQWLLLFDNYDDPDQFDISKYCPYVGHGSIVITTRLPELAIGQPVRVRPLTSIEESLEILQARSGREHVKSGKCSYFPTGKGFSLIMMTRSCCSSSSRTNARPSTCVSDCRRLPSQEHIHLRSISARI